MKSDKRSLRIYITVDSSKVARCKWCGSAESENWLETQSGMYCSKECNLAGQANDSLLGFVMIIVFMPIILAMGGPRYPSTVIIGSAILVALFSPLLYCGLVGHSHRMKIPKGSRRDQVSSDIALLKAVSSPVLCPRCDANLDVTKVGQDRVFTCDYCGASGTIEILQTNKD